jgi:hypothetical protein
LLSSSKLVPSDGCIVLRANAVGDYGGIEAILEAMRQLPSNFVFLMMGRSRAERLGNPVGSTV